MDSKRSLLEYIRRESAIIEAQIHQVYLAVELVSLTNKRIQAAIRKADIEESTP